MCAKSAKHQKKKEQHTKKNVLQITKLQQPNKKKKRTHTHVHIHIDQWDRTGSQQTTTKRAVTKVHSPQLENNNKTHTRTHTHADAHL